MRGVQFEHVEAGLFGVDALPARTRRARRPCRRASWRVGSGCAGSRVRRLGAISSQLPVSSGSSMPSQPSWVEPFRPEWPSCRQIFASLCACTKSTMRFQACICASVYMPAQPGVMRPCGVTQVISVKTRLAPPKRARTEMHQMEVVRHAVMRAVGRHRRYHDAIGKLHVAQLEWQEHRRDGAVRRAGVGAAWRASPRCPPAMDDRGGGGFRG